MQIKEKLRSMDFRQRIALLLILFTMLPSLVIWQILARQYRKEVLSGASQAVHSVVSANNEVLRMGLKQVEDGVQLILNDKEYYDFFSRLSQAEISDYMYYDRLLTSDMVGQFTLQPQVYTSWLWTSQWVFGNGRGMSIDWKGIQDSGVLEMAKEAGGAPCWLSGYDYGEKMGSAWLREKAYYDYRYCITMIRQMRFQYSDPGAYHTLPEGEEWPVIFVHILERDLRRSYEGSISYEGSMCGITNEEGNIVSSDCDRFPVSGSTPWEIFRHMGQSGYEQCCLQGEDYLLCFDSIQDPQWLSWSLVPMDTLVKDTMAQMERLQMLCLCFFTLLSVLVAQAVSRTVTKPLGVLTAAVGRVSNGSFTEVAPMPEEKDFRILTESFNHMVKEIDKLIRENYLIRLREREAQLEALSMQINPHFLYNTLNTINMLAIRNGDEETSDLIASLSEMLRYTLKKESGKIMLVRELDWARNYLCIMEKRYEGVFLADIEIGEGLSECLVPRLILQPLVENAILHGFRELKSGGRLLVAVRREEERLHIRVEDNGKGMDEETRRACLSDAPGKEGIGMANVHERLKLMYGKAYERRVVSAPGEGTCIDLYFPFEEEKA